MKVKLCIYIRREIGNLYIVGNINYYAGEAAGRR